MRLIPIVAALSLVALALGANASARPWTDPGGRIVIDVPAGWTISSRRSDTFSYIIAGNANNECQFIATPNLGTESISAATARLTMENDAQFDEPFWLRLANGLNTVFPDNSAAFISRSRDDGGAWPTQRAELRAPERPVHAGMQIRPGMDLIGVCMTYDGAEPIAVYDQVLRSMAHPNDAVWAAEAAMAPAPPPPAPQ